MTVMTRTWWTEPDTPATSCADMFIVRGGDDVTKGLKVVVMYLWMFWRLI